MQFAETFGYDDIHVMRDDQQDLNTDTSSNRDASGLLRVEELIKANVAKIDSLRLEINKSREMVDNALTSDETYREHDRLAQVAVKVRSKTKSEIMKQPTVASFAGKLKELKEQQKELKNVLGNYLADYQRMSGTNTIEIDGEVREIVYVPKLVKKSAFRP